MQVAEFKEEIINLKGTIENVRQEVKKLTNDMMSDIIIIL